MPYCKQDHTRRNFFYLLLLLSSFTLLAGAATVRGTITDSLSAVIPNARVELMSGSTSIASATADSAGRYEFHDVSAGRYKIRANAPSFDWTASNPFYVGEAANASVDLLLAVGAVSQTITVTATGTPTPQAQVGASVTLLSRDDYADKLDVHEALRLVPGVQLTQTGRRGGLGDLFVRGGNSNANKVLLDGIPANDIGGDVDFGVLATAGIDQIEVLRGPNSALYGADALASVVSINTPRGTTPLPEITYSVDGGNFGTYRQEGTLGGSHKQFDYFSDFSRFDTANGAVRDSFHNGTFAGNVGWTPGPNTELRATVRRLVTAAGEPNAIQLFGIPDNVGQKEQETFIGATFQHQTTSRWHNLLRYGALRLRSQFTDYSPTGISYNSPVAGPLYIGAPVVIRGANGYSVSGQAAFQFPGNYPNQFITSADRDFAYAQTTYQVKPQLNALLGFRYEAERGFTQSSFGKSPADRRNYSYTLQVAGSLANRFYYTLGSGIENNAIFGVEATPRVSLAYYMMRPDSSRVFSGTKVRGSFGTGIKEPSIFNAGNSLFSLLQQLSGGQQLISQFHVTPIGAERSRTYDGGIEQSLFEGRARLGITYFHNEFTHMVEFVPMQGLIDIGVPQPIAQALQFGATVNSQAFRAQGGEAELEYRLGRGLVAHGGYTYLDAVVQRSFTSDALGPSFNLSSTFPTIPIGAFSPLTGARPFRRAPHSGYLALSYRRSKWTGSLTGTFVGRRDDSDFLSDKDFGTTMLLPNRNLDGAYQKLDIGGSYQVNHTLSVYSDLQNLLNQHYAEAFGYPALPFTFRSGIRITLGDETWKLK
ncbi:MAG TPA: TonB-dependent receptor [Candidatus Acidoferrum sp.]|nr:TonB-dependent receptor [Candidatus Acidoferrum sp.]